MNNFEQNNDYLVMQHDEDRLLHDEDRMLHDVTHFDSNRPKRRPLASRQAGIEKMSSRQAGIEILESK